MAASDLTINVRVTDLDEFQDVVRRICDRFERIGVALGDAEAWLADTAPAWVREEVAAARMLCRADVIAKGEG